MPLYIVHTQSGVRMLSVSVSCQGRGDMGVAHAHNAHIPRISELRAKREEGQLTSDNGQMTSFSVLAPLREPPTTRILKTTKNLFLTINQSLTKKLFEVI